MNKKNVIEDIILENNDDIEIEYNEDFSSEKTKSLTKFPIKITKNNEFNIDNSRQNFSKSLNFNFRQCFAPKSKSKKSSKNPTPIIFKKNKNLNSLDTQEEIINEDFLSEKGSSLNNDSFYSSDSEKINELNDDNNKLNNIIIENENIINDEKNINYEIKKNDNTNKNIKSYEHKTISFLQGKITSNKNIKDIKKVRINLLKIKFEALSKIYKEMEYKIKEKYKIKYNLDLIQNLEKLKGDNNYKIIKINDIEENINPKEEEDSNEDMSKFRKTISFSKSKFNKELNKKDENKGFTIFDILTNKKKNN